MKLQWANFKFGGVPVYPEDGEGVTPPSNPQAPDINSTKNIRFQPNTGVWYKYTTSVNPCSSKESVTASMQMKLQPVSDDQNFWTNKCGTDDFINFQIIGTDGDEGNPDLNGTADKNPTAPTTPKAPTAPKAPKSPKAPKTKSPSLPKKTKSPTASDVIAKPSAGDVIADKPNGDASKSPKKSKSPNASKSPTVGKGGKGSVDRKRRRATSRRTPVRA